MTNFVVDDVSGPVAYAVYPPWGTLGNETLAASPDLVRIGPVFGVIPRAETSSTAPPMPANDDKYRFTFEGITYRLSGLVVQGELGTLITSNQAQHISKKSFAFCHRLLAIEQLNDALLVGIQQSKVSSNRSPLFRRRKGNFPLRSSRDNMERRHSTYVLLLRVHVVFVYYNLSTFNFAQPR